ncbi:MAG: aKG-HExxH-type peptide beta-hydroxylase [Bacteriovoracaceae bacterium]
MKLIENISQASEELKSCYSESLEELQSETEELTEVLDTNFIEEIQKFNFNLLKDYSPINFYFVEFWERVFYLAEVLKEASEFDFQEESINTEELIEELYDFFEATEFYKIFCDRSQDENPFEVASDLLSLFQGHLITFYYLHIHNQDYELLKPLSYVTSNDLGDTQNIFFIRNQAFETKDSILELKSFEHNDEGLSIFDPDEKEINQRVGKSSAANQDFPFLLKIQDKSQIEDIKKQTLEALTVLSEASPDCHQLLLENTWSLISFQEKNMVSYSMQNFPGVSFINFADRDFVDLLDDLVHENGHHILNKFLTLDELIVEDDEKIFYSLWRRAPRPIRGIYHAYCTFYWALKLFTDLGKYIESHPHSFDDDQVFKIKHRVYEEYLYLTNTKEELARAYQMDKVTDEGLEVQKLFDEEVQKSKDYFEKVENEFKSEKVKYRKKMIEQTLKTIESFKKFKR